MAQWRISKPSEREPEMPGKALVTQVSEPAGPCADCGGTWAHRYRGSDGRLRCINHDYKRRQGG